MNFLDKYQLVLKQAEQLELLAQSLERALVYHRDVAPILHPQEFRQTEALWKRMHQRLTYLLQIPVDQHLSQLQAVFNRTNDPMVAYILGCIQQPLESYRTLYTFIYHLNVVRERHPDDFQDTV